MPRAKRLDSLTERELEVLAHLQRGLTNEEIASNLGITVAGAKYHVSQILAKLGVVSREEAGEWRPPERNGWRRVLVALPVAAKIAAVTVLATTLVGVGALAWGVSRTSTDSNTSPQATRIQLLQNVPTDAIDGSTGSDKLEAPPENAFPAIAAKVATQRASSSGSLDGDVLETVLVSYTNLVESPPVPRLAWVVNYDPATVSPMLFGGCFNGCPSPEELATGFAFVLIDAVSGELINSHSTSYVVSPSPTHP